MPRIACVYADDSGRPHVVKCLRGYYHGRPHEATCLRCMGGKNPEKVIAPVSGIKNVRPCKGCGR